MTLYELTQEGLEVERLLTESDGVLTPEMEERFDSMLRGGKDKIEAAARVRSNLKANAQACEDEIARIKSRLVSFQNQAQALEARMLVAIDAAFGGKVQTAAYTIWGQNTGSTVSFELAPDADMALLDPSVIRTRVELDRAALQQMHKSGAALPNGIEVRENAPTRYLRVK